MSYGVMPARGRGWPFPETHAEVALNGDPVVSARGNKTCVGLWVKCDTSGALTIVDAAGGGANYYFMQNTAVYLPGHFTSVTADGTFDGHVVAQFATT